MELSLLFWEIVNQAAQRAKGSRAQPSALASLPDFLPITGPHVPPTQQRPIPGPPHTPSLCLKASFSPTHDPRPTPSLPGLFLFIKSQPHGGYL